jgi:hypothetical protein
MTRRSVLLLFAFSCLIGVGLPAAMGVSGGADDPPGNLSVSIRDFCDPATFEALGHGTCIRDDDVSVNGAQTLAGFGTELAQEKSVGAWRFNPQNASTEEGVDLTLLSRGGETHTFTRVADFGGGFVAALNAASGNPVPRPECAQVLSDGRLIPQPQSANNIFLTHGQTVPGPRIVEDEEAKFQCCIHPWMRITINPDESGHHHRD